MASRAGVGLILFVDDIGTAIQFYCSSAKLFSVEVDARITPKVRNTRLRHAYTHGSFYLILSDAADDRHLVGRQGGNSALLVLPIDDCWETFNRMSAEGVRFVSPPVELPYGVQATFVDPFGNRVCLSQEF